MQPGQFSNVLDFTVEALDWHYQAVIYTRWEASEETQNMVYEIRLTPELNVLDDIELVHDNPSSAHEV